MSDRNFTQRFDVFMTSLSSDNKITVQQCYICGERCDNDVMKTSKRCVKFISLIFILKCLSKFNLIRIL